MEIQSVCKVHMMDNLSEQEMLDASQTEDEFIEDGDVFTCCRGRVIGFMYGSWPVVLFGTSNERVLQRPEGPEGRWYLAKKYPTTWKVARELAVIRGLALAEY